jgi:hypothetical protein
MGINNKMSLFKNLVRLSKAIYFTTRTRTVVQYGQHDKDLQTYERTTHILYRGFPHITV